MSRLWRWLFGPSKLQQARNCAEAYCDAWCEENGVSILLPWESASSLTREDGEG